MSVLLDYSTLFLLGGDGFSSTQAHDNISATLVGDGLGQARPSTKSTKRLGFFTAVNGWRNRDSFFRGLMFRRA
jgi:hypothetical protein